MKKRLIVALSTVAMLCFLTACGTSQWEDLGISFTENIFAGDYKGATENMDDSLKDSFTEDTMTTMVTSITTQYGAYEKVISATVGTDTDYPDYKIVKVNVQLAEGKIQLELAYDDDKMLCGINLLGSEDLSETATTDVDYRSDAKTFLKAIFDGDTATAYGMLDADAQSTYTEDNLTKLKDESESTYGTFDSFGPASQDGYSVVVNALFYDGSAEITVEFDSEGLISDFSVAGSEG